MADKIKIEGWLPVFPGFYETMFGFDYDRACETEESNITMFGDNQDEVNKIDPAIKEYIDDNYINWFDYREYEQDVAKLCVRYINDKLRESEPKCPQITFIYEKINSPREYNFVNDSIDCQLEFEMSEFENIVDYLHDYDNDFAKHIEERFTSRSGFHSFYSNDSQDWLDEFDNFIDNAEVTKDLVFKVSYAIEWYLLHSNKEEEYRGYGENLLEMEMYEYLSDNDIHPSNYFRDNEAKANINKIFKINIMSLEDLITEAETLNPIYPNPNQLEMFD